ncbi:hypothetical protein K1719_023413 [Acacia pycnantha]|nr:hypothetical protein K1719_023413 [Acacia pycnantha]
MRLAGNLSVTPIDYPPTLKKHDGKYWRSLFDSRVGGRTALVFGARRNRILQKRHEVPPNFRRALSTRLRRLVAQGKLEKVQNCYKIKKDTPSGAKTLHMKQKDIWQHQPQASSIVPSHEITKDAADTAAYRLVEAENKSFFAAEAAREAERLAKLAENKFHSAIDNIHYAKAVKLMGDRAGAANVDFFKILSEYIEVELNEAVVISMVITLVFLWSWPQ